MFQQLHPQPEHAFVRRQHTGGPAIRTTDTTAAPLRARESVRPVLADFGSHAQAAAVSGVLPGCLPPPTSVAVLLLLWPRRLAQCVRAAHAAETVGHGQIPNYNSEFRLES